jgi:hypothetical protein
MIKVLQQQEVKGVLFLLIKSNKNWYVTHFDAKHKEKILTELTYGLSYRKFCSEVHAAKFGRMRSESTAIKRYIKMVHVAQDPRINFKIK